MAHKRRNRTRAGTRRYWSAVRHHERTALARGEEPRPTAPRRQTRSDNSRPVI